MNIKIQDLMAPWSIAAAISLSGMLSLIIPADFYGIYLKEKNYMFLNSDVAIYIILCTVVFSLAAWGGSRISRSAYHLRNSYFYKSYPANLFTLSVMTLITSLLIVYQIYTINTQISVLDLMADAFSGSGGMARQRISEAISSGKVGWISIFAAIYLSWIYYSYLKYPSSIKKLLLVIVSFLFLISCLISISRDTIVTSMIMLLVVYGRVRIYEKRVNIFKLLAYLTIFVFLFIVFFVGFDYIRSGNLNSGSAVAQILGYFPASYNRLAAIMSGSLIYPNSGWGYYTGQLIWDLPIINRLAAGILDIPSRIMPSDSYENWISQFRVVGQSLLNPKYIWATVFGFAYADYKYYALVFFVVYGGISGLVYGGFNQSRTSCIIFYPLVIASIFKWWSIITISQRSTLIAVMIFFMISFFAAISYFLTRRRI